MKKELHLEGDERAVGWEAAPSGEEKTAPPRKPVSWAPAVLAVIRYELLVGARDWKIVTVVIMAILASALQWLPTPIVREIPPPPYPYAVVGPRYDYTLGGGEILIFFAVVMVVDSLVGELEQGTMIALVSKPVSRSMVLLGKFFASILLLAATVGFALSTDAVLASLTYGPQNDLQLVPLELAGYVFAGTVFLAMMFALATLSRSTIAVTLGAIAYYIAEQVVVNSNLTLANLLPGYGMGLLNPNPGSGDIGAGLADIGQLLAYYIQHPGIQMVSRTLQLAPLSGILIEDAALGSIYICAFLTLAFAFFRRTLMK